MSLPDGIWQPAASGRPSGRCGLEAADGIKDYDLVYLDPVADEAAEESIEREFTERWSSFNVELDIRNEAFNPEGAPHV